MRAGVVVAWKVEVLGNFEEELEKATGVCGSRLPRNVIVSLRFCLLEYMVIIGSSQGKVTYVWRIDDVSRYR